MKPKPGKVFVRWDTEGVKYRKLKSTTQEDLDRNISYELDERDLDGWEEHEKTL